jgi:ATP-dependent DNA helicase DinG
VKTLKQRYHDILATLPSVEPRPSQEAMVLQVGSAIAHGQSLVIEAGTGSGKSFGYLIPLLLEATKPVVVSTGTIALQEQLLAKDVPFLLKATGLNDLSVSLVKGRGNYLCIQKLRELERDITPGAPERRTTEALNRELELGWDGDQASLDWGIPHAIWEEVQSNSEDCLGRRCIFYQDNPYKKARDKVAKADLIIANHALYLNDRFAGQALLPDHSVVVFDEAHTLKSYALNALTARIGKFATTKLLRKIQRRLEPIPEPFIQGITEAEAMMMRWLMRMERPSFRLIPDAEFFAIVQRTIDTLTQLLAWLNSLDIHQLQLVTTDLDADRATVQRGKLLGQLQALVGSWEFFLEPDPFKVMRVNWAEIDTQRLYYELKSTPLNLDDMLRNGLWTEVNAILTSATLSTGPDTDDGSGQLLVKNSDHLTYFMQDIGLDGAEGVVLPSPFNYAKQCALYLPQGMPEPNDIDYNRMCAEEIEALLCLSQGRAFVLFTSIGNMRKVATALMPQLPYPCKIQGDLPRNRLIDWFKATPNSVLFATATFWEGIDIPGESLSLVIIDKIPFVSPEDPVHQATVDYLKAKGKDWFNQYALPMAIIKLKQGFGRLIRSKQDTGVVAILDPRMQTKGYGRKIRQSLPSVPVLHTLSQVAQQFSPMLNPKLQQKTKGVLVT